MVNGYVTLDLASNKIYKEALGAIKSGKPVMVVDAPQVYFADTISVVSDNVVITKGGKTITITDANAVSSVGDIQKHLYYTTINVSCEDDSYNFYFSIALNTNTKITSLTSTELIELLNNYNNVILFGYAVYNESKYTELTFQIVNGSINEIGFDKGDDSTNPITTFTSINVKSVQIY